MSRSCVAHFTDRRKEGRVFLSHQLERRVSPDLEEQRRRRQRIRSKGRRTISPQESDATVPRSSTADTRLESMMLSPRSSVEAAGEEQRFTPVIIRTIVFRWRGQWLLRPLSPSFLVSRQTPLSLSLSSLQPQCVKRLHSHEGRGSCLQLTHPFG